MTEPGPLTYSRSMTRKTDFAVTPIGQPGEVVAVVATEQLALCLCQAWNAKHQAVILAPSLELKLTP